MMFEIPSVLPLLALLAMIIGGGIYAFKQGERKGSESEKLDQANEALDDVTKAKDIEDRWNSDPAFRDRLRDKFTKK